MEDLDGLCVLDERGHIDPTIGVDGESARTVRENLETARALEALPPDRRGGTLRSAE